MNYQHITGCSTPDPKTHVPSEAGTASPGLNAEGYHGPILDRGIRFAALNFQQMEIKTMINNTFKVTGMAAAVALAAGMLGARPVHAYDAATIQTYDLGKPAAFLDSKTPLAQIAARPNGGAYIQWVTSQNYSNGHRYQGNATVNVTTVDNNGVVVGSDIQLGNSLPGGIAATTNSFGYYLVDGDKLTFGVGNPGASGAGQVVMDNRDKTPPPSSNVVNYRRGFADLGGAAKPVNVGRSGVAFGNNRFGTIFQHSKDFFSGQPENRTAQKPHNSHDGDGIVFFNGDGSNGSVSNGWSTSHSIDQRIAFDASDNSFYTLTVGDAHPKDFRLRKFNSAGTQAYTNDLLNKTGGVAYTDNLPGSKADEGFQQTPDGSSTLQQVYGVGGDRLGTSSGRLGEIHPLGNGTVALTYGIKPRYYNWGPTAQTRERRNQVEFALINSQGQLTERKRIWKADAKAGQGNYTVDLPAERLRWVKSARVGSRIVIVWQTETWDGQNLSSPSYNVSDVRMAQVDLQGNVTQAVNTIPANKAKFNLGDGIVALSNGTLAWTHTGDNTLKLSLLAPPNLSGSLPTAPPAPTAQAATNVSFNDFTANWNAVNGASSYRIDVSANNFETFVVQDLAVTATSYSVAGLQPNTAYKYRVRSFNNAGGGQNSNEINQQTVAVPTLPTACTPTAATPRNNGTWTIKKFELKDAQNNVVISNTQNNNGVIYEDFTSQVIKANSGAVFSYAVTSSGNGPTDIWIDSNNNGTLELASERVVHNTNASNKAGQLTLPALQTGFYRMRVRVMPNYRADPCYANDWGQVEDYTLQIGAGTGTGTSTPSSLRINVAGSGLTTSMGDFTALPAAQVTGGRDWNRNNAVANTTDDALYQRMRYGQMQFNIPVSDGSYTVRLHFADLYWSAAGRRVFNVDIEGNQVLSNFDVIAEAGSNNTALVKTFTVQVSDQNMDVDFINVTDNAIISAIEIIPGSSTGHGGGGTTPTPAAFKATLQGAQSNKCVDVPARNTADNVGIVQWTCNGGPNQKMTFTPVTGKVDVYTLVFEHSNKCLHVPGTANGTDLIQMTCDNSTSQQFKRESVGGNLYKLTAQNSGKGLDVEGYSTADNGKIQQWDYVGGQNQKWRVVRDL